METARNVTIKVCLDAVLLLIAGTPILVFKYGVNPFKRGFFCDDESIAHPYKDDTISTPVLAAVGLGIPLLTMFIGELILYRRSLFAVDLETASSGMRDYYTLFGKYVHPYLASAYISVGAFLIGAAICQSTTDLVKYSLGRLRPHFFDACELDWSKIQCTDAQGHMQYIEDFECLGNPKHVKESRLSHPSGHASLSFYCMLYFCVRNLMKKTKLSSKSHI